MTPYWLTAIGGASAFSKPRSIRSICTELPVGKPVLNEYDLTRVRPKSDVASQPSLSGRLLPRQLRLALAAQGHQRDAGALPDLHGDSISKTEQFGRRAMSQPRSKARCRTASQNSFFLAVNRQCDSHDETH